MNNQSYIFIHKFILISLIDQQTFISIIQRTKCKTMTLPKKVDFVSIRESDAFIVKRKKYEENSVAHEKMKITVISAMESNNLINYEPAFMLLLFHAAYNSHSNFSNIKTEVQLLDQFIVTRTA